jgi:hypothetical protein
VPGRAQPGRWRHAGSILRPIFRVFWVSNPSKTCSTSYVIDSTHECNKPTETRAVQNHAKNNVTSRGRLDEKYAERRAVQKLAQCNLISRVFSEYFSRKRCPARVQLGRRYRQPRVQLPGGDVSPETSCLARTISEQLTLRQDNTTSTTMTIDWSLLRLNLPSACAYTTQLCLYSPR